MARLNQQKIKSRRQQTAHRKRRHPHGKRLVLLELPHAKGKPQNRPDDRARQDQKRRERRVAPRARVLLLLVLVGQGRGALREAPPVVVARVGVDAFT